MKFKKIVTIFLIYLNLLSHVSAGLYISEIMPNTDDDVNLEYIELTNSGNLNEYLSGYIISDESQKQFVFGSGIFLESLESRKFYRPDTKILLNNISEKIYLYDNSGNLVDSLFYKTSKKGVAIIVGNNSGIIETNSGIIVEGTGIIETNSGIIVEGTGIIETNSGIIVEGTGIIETNSGIIVEGTGIIETSPQPSEETSPQPSPLEEREQDQNIIFSGSIDEGNGIIETNSGIIDDKLIKFDIVYKFQNPTYLLEKEQVIGIYNCDSSKEECKINLDFRNTFTGGLKEGDFECILDFGFGSGIYIGEENKCNPGTFILPVGNYNFNFLIQNKTNTGIFSTGSFSVINNGYIKPIKISNSSPINYITTISKIYFNTSDIIVQSGLGEDNLCKNNDCKINLNYIPENSNLSCEWDFDGGIFETQDTNKKCNPGYVAYNLGDYRIKLKVYQKDMVDNYKEVYLNFSNKEIISSKISKDILLQLPILEEKKQEQISEEKIIFDLKLLNKIKINKVMPNPVGADNLEFIELINLGNNVVNLKGCSLDDEQSGGSKIFSFNSDNFLFPNKTKKIYKSESKLNLNNDNDEVIFSCGDNIIDKLSWNFLVTSGFYLSHERLEIENSEVNVIDVVDGDTIKIKFLNNGHIETLRLIGVDTPETKHPNKIVEEFGLEAFEFTKSNLLGKNIFLEIDKNNFRDKYSRLLGFVYLDNKNFNKILIEKGFARAYTTYDFKYIQEFIIAENIAKQNKIGVWSLDNFLDIKLNEKIEEDLIKEEEINFFDLNNNGIPDEFEELKYQTGTILEDLTGSILYEIDLEKSSEKYLEYIKNSFTIGYSKLKSGLKIYGKTIPNIEIYINLKEKKDFSFLDFFINKASADYLYNTKSDINGNFEFLLTEIFSGNFEINSKIIDGFGNEITIEKIKKLIIEEDYIINMKQYVYNKYLKGLSKYSDEVKINSSKLSNGEKGIEDLIVVIKLQGKIGLNKKLVGDTIYCYNTCSVNFDGSSSSGKIIKYLWDFGNGIKYEGKNPGYIKYIKFGNYKVTLTLIGEKKEIAKNFYVKFSKKIKQAKIKNIKTKNNNLIVNISNAGDIQTLEEETQNNNGILSYLIIMILTIILLFIILRKEKLI